MTNKPNGKANTHFITKEKIIALFEKNPVKVFNEKQLCKRLGIDDIASKKMLSKYLTDLTAEHLTLVGKRCFRWKEKPKVFEGKIELTNDLNAYLIQKKKDIFIPRNFLHSALNGDVVSVEVSPSRRGYKEGKVIKVIKRKKQTFTGFVRDKKSKSVLVSNEKKMPYEIVALNREKFVVDETQKVEVEITDWKYTRRSMAGNIVRILGKKGESKTEMLALMSEFGLPKDFPKKVETEAQTISKQALDGDLKGRLDMRDTTTFTIDPVDAKDFDDALSIRNIGDELFEIGVHIADVSHYVKTGSQLDQEAYHRGNSVYLADRVVPMLPEALSNNICSLRPNEDKRTFSVIFTMNEKAEIKKFDIRETRICSNRRFAYEEVQEILETKKGEYNTELLRLHRMASVLREQRMKEGSIDFETQELRFEIDEEGMPIRAKVRERKDAHKLVEDFMLLANRTIAAYVQKNHPQLPFVFRVHDKPDPEMLKDFSKFAKIWGYRLKLDSPQHVARELNAFLGNLVGKQEHHALSSFAIRCMSKAIYSTENIGHYGLGFHDYTHFTSPIRRYADLEVHRIVKSCKKGKKRMDATHFEGVCEHISGRERLAMDAERASTKLMQAQYIAAFLGQEFEGIVSGITHWGIFVELKDNLCEGLIRMSDLKGDFYEFFPDKFYVRGRATCHRIGLGDSIQVAVKNVDVEKREIDLELVLRPKQ